jgi:hypothetical protein
VRVGSLTWLRENRLREGRKLKVIDKDRTVTCLFRKQIVSSKEKELSPSILVSLSVSFCISFCLSSPPYLSPFLYSQLNFQNRDEGEDVQERVNWARVVFILPNGHSSCITGN